MPNPTSIKKIIQKKLSELTIQVFEQLAKTRATDKVKKSLNKISRKAGRSVHNLVKKSIKKNEKKEIKTLTSKKKRTVVKKPKKVVVV